MFFEGDDKLKGVHGVEAKSLAEQRLVVSDVAGRHALEMQLGHDQLFEVGAQGGVVEVGGIVRHWFLAREIGHVVVGAGHRSTAGWRSAIGRKRWSATSKKKAF